jgi:basic amino acid/polyamine antiporter, APA family
VRHPKYFATKSIDKLIAESERPERPAQDARPGLAHRLGIGAVIGSGIFTVIGTAIGGKSSRRAGILGRLARSSTYMLHHTSDAVAGRPGAGPALALSLVLVAIVCAFTGLCYAELASMIPIAGSAYTYTYATMGELIAWIIGWDLILEYAFSNMSVSVGFAAHIRDLLDWFGWHPRLRWISPAYLARRPAGSAGNTLYAPGWHFGFNIPAFLIVLLLTVVLVRGIRESARDQQHHGPAEDRGHPGSSSSAACASFILRTIIPSCPRLVRRAHRRLHHLLHLHRIRFRLHRGEECKNPQRDVPIGIIATLIVCTVLYIGVAVVLTGIVPWRSLIDDAAPVVNSLSMRGNNEVRALLHWTELAVLFGAMMGMISSMLVFQLGQARVWFSMSRDRLLPEVFSRVHPRFRTPAFATWVAGFLVGIPAGILDIGTLVEMSNIGTLFAFVLVSPASSSCATSSPIAVAASASRRPGCADPQRLLLHTADGRPARLTWLRFFIWLAIGLVIYVFYSRKRSEFLQCPSNPEPPANPAIPAARWASFRSSALRRPPKRLPA